MRHQDTMTGFVLLVFCAITYWLTTGFTEIPAMLSQNIPPTFFPRLVLSIIALLSILLIAMSIRRRPEITTRIPPAVWISGAIIALAGAVTGVLGTLPTLGLVAVVLPIAWGERRYPVIGALAVCLPGSIYVIFTLGLGVRFPVGRLLEIVFQA